MKPIMEARYEQCIKEQLMLGKTMKQIDAEANAYLK